MPDKKAKIYVGSWDFIPEASPLFIRSHLTFIKPGWQEIWEYYQLVIDKKLVISMHYIPYNPINDSDNWRYEDAGAHLAIEINQRGLGINDYEIINGKKIDLETLEINNEVEIEIDKLNILESKLKKTIN